MSANEKKSLIDTYRNRDDLSQIVTLLKSDIDLADDDPEKLYKNYEVFNLIAGIYTNSLVDFSLAEKYNNLFKNEINRLLSEDKINKREHTELVKAYHVRNIHILNLTFNKKALAEYRGSEFLALYKDLLERNEKVDCSSPAGSIYCNLEKAIDSNDKNGIVENYLELTNTIKELDRKAYKASLMRNYERQKELDSMDKRYEMSSLDLAVHVWTTVLGAPFMIPMMMYYVPDKYNHMKNSFSVFKRDSLYDLESEDNRALNKLLSPVKQIDLFYEVAKAAEGINNKELAISSYYNCIGVLENLRSTLVSDNDKINYFSNKAQVYEKLCILLVELGRVDEAFIVSGRSKSRALVDLMASRIFENLKDPIIDKEKLRQGKLRSLLGQANISHSQARSICVELKAGSAEDYATAEMLRMRSLTTVKSPGKSEIEKMVPFGVTVVELLYSDKDVLTLCYNHANGFFVKHLPGSSAKLSNHLKALYAQLEYAQQGHRINVESYDAESSEIYKMLLSGLEPKLTDRLLFIPHRDLNGFPFHSLFKGDEYLVEKYTIGVLPSLSLVGFISDSFKSEKMMLVGNVPYSDIPALRFTKDEIRSIYSNFPSSTILSEAQATKDNVLTKMKGFDVLHFAGHAYFHDEDPLLSGLVLKDDHGEDVVISGYDILQTQTPSTVILSACDTGLARVFGGVETVGLTRAFFFSGTDRIISTLWEVNDLSTMETVGKIYSQLREMDPAEALRVAQVEMLKMYKSPYHWASFQYNGIP